MKRIAMLLCIAGSLFASGCTGGTWVRTTVAEQYEFRVDLEEYREEGTEDRREYAHPLEMESFELGQVMGGLKYLEEGGLMKDDQQRAVFQEAEVERLAPVLADALARAGAGQRIRFLSFNQGKAWMFSRPRKTEGVMFAEPGGRLNLAFGYINAERQARETTAAYANYAKADPLGIRDSDTPLTDLPPYAELHSLESGGRAPMWVVVDRGELEASIEAEPAPPAPSTGEPAPVAVDSPAEKTEPVRAPRTAPGQEIKDKLRFLKELRDEGLITEKDYAAKKEDLLDRID